MFRGASVVPEVKKLRDDLFRGLDDSDPDLVSLDLESVMKSFEVEISASSSSPTPVVDLTFDSAKSQPDLGFLLEALDDELGYCGGKKKLQSVRRCV
ncbi:hypothetical protein SLA2020_393000 [Shorea laevis]